MPLKYKSRTRIPKTYDLDWDKIFDDLNASGKCFVVCNCKPKERPIVYCNDAFCSLTGYLKSEVVQQNATGAGFLDGQLTDEESMHDIDSALSHKKSVTKEILLYKADGTPFWSLVRTETIAKRDQSYEEAYMIVTHKDISTAKLRRCHSNQFLGKHTLLWDEDRKASIQDPNGVIFKPNQDLINTIIDAGHHHKAKEKLAQIISLDRELLPEYREIRQTSSRFIILHYGLFRELWNWFIILLCFYTAVAIPVYAAFNYNRNTLSAINLFIDFIAIVDVVLNFRTTYVNSAGRLVADPSLIAHRYLRSWFIVDCISALPLEIVGIIIQSSTSMLMLIHVPKILRLTHLYRLASKLDSVTRYAFGLSVLSLLLIAFLLVAHWLACAWTAIGLAQGPTGWVYTLANSTEVFYYFNGTFVNGTVVNGTLEGGPSDGDIYVTALYFAIQSLTTVGFGNFSATTFAERLFAIFAMIIGALLYATIFGNVTATFEQLYANRLRYRSRFNDIHDFVRLHGIKDPLRQRLIDHLDAVWLHTRGIATDDVLRDFPVELQSDICMHLNRSLLSTNAAFSRASPGCLRMLSLRLKRMHAAPGEDIVHRGDKLTKLYFVATGTVEILMKKEVVALLGKGDVFGQDFASDSASGKAWVDVRAVSYCDIHYISRSDFLDVLKSYPEFSTTFSENLNLSYDVRSEVPLPETPVHSRRFFSRGRSPRGTPRRLSVRLDELDEATNDGVAAKTPVSDIFPSSDVFGSDDLKNPRQFTRDERVKLNEKSGTVTFQKDAEKIVGNDDIISLSKFSRTSIRTSLPELDVDDPLDAVTTRMGNMEDKLQAIEQSLERVLLLMSNKRRRLPTVDSAYGETSL
ncbi:potassium voltage-gated channel subfamily H member 1-like [Oscarella lobularis]|uniref:potassium voltage-gated channel subfamily H member 1-like n=1 Tax=Oscarella lobularis TaxID=121494 RepID=UPI003313F6BD